FRTDCAVLTSDENSVLFFSTPDTAPLASACSSAVLVSDPVVPVTFLVRAVHSPAAVCGMLAGDDEADADADGEAVCGGTIPPWLPDADGDGESEGAGDWVVQPGTGVAGVATLVWVVAGDEPEKVPVLAASATPPPPTARAAAMTFTVRILASGDFIICSLRESATDAR